MNISGPITTFVPCFAIMPSKDTSALRALGKADPALATALGAIGSPVVRTRPGGFEGLFRIIVEQQISVPSAQSILARCHQALTISPAGILAASEDELRAQGLSGPKIRYVRAAATAVKDKTLDVDGLGALGDEDAADQLLAITGIGPWTAAIYLLFCDGRVNVWPPKDVALLAAYTHAAGLTEKPAMAAFDQMAHDRFAPHRGHAAHILWTYYAHIKNRTPL